MVQYVYLPTSPLYQGVNYAGNFIWWCCVKQNKMRVTSEKKKILSSGWMWFCNTNNVIIYFVYLFTYLF